MVKKAAIIQARVNSKRLHEKIFYSIPFNSNFTVIEQIVKRSKIISNIDDVIIATNEMKDNKLDNIAKVEGVKIFKGNENNVLKRFYCAAKKNNVDIILRITGDNPCIDSLLISTVLENHIRTKADYTKTEGYPIGLNVEVFDFSVLEKAYKNATQDYEKEHVTPYINRNPDIFKINIVKAPKELNAPDIRITLDTEEDYALLCAVFDYLYPENKYFNAYEIVKLFKEKAWLKLINKKIVQKKIFNTLEEELEEAKRILDLQDLKRARDFIGEYISK
jgi:spore coat polysaccharide biosynthesis protein SpsF